MFYLKYKTGRPSGKSAGSKTYILRIRISGIDECIRKGKKKATDNHVPLKLLNGPVRFLRIKIIGSTPDNRFVLFLF